LSLPLFEPTYTVSDLCAEVRDFLGEAFSSLWVAGEVQRLRPSRRGHLYFELIEKGDDDEIRGKLDAVLWRTDHLRVQRVLAAAGQQIAEGREIRCRGGLDFYGQAGRLQLVVREVDPVFTLGLLARRRQEVLAELAAAGLLERNRALALPALPLDIALITSEGSAAYHDFLATLSESGYGFRVLFLHAAVQGRGAEREIASALAALGGLAVDCAVLIRGGGSRADLAVFDSREVALAVARAPVPVLTGLGHEIDLAIADRVAHTASKTPTKAAELLVARVAAAEGELAALAGELRRAATAPLARGREALGAAERGLRLARLPLAHARSRLGECARALGRSGRGRVRAGAVEVERLGQRLRGAAPRSLERRRGAPEELGRRFAGAAGAHLREARATLAGLARLCSQLAPERTLERGFTITRRAGGAVVRRPEEVAAGERIVTETAAGAFPSRVEAG
jgi:exodeoxyribonuclease VII large subunit